MRPHPIWIYARQIARWKTLSGDLTTRALVVDLEDPVLAPLLDLAPTPRDIADERGKLAGPRKYFLRRRALLRKLVSLRLGCSPADVVVTHDADGAPRVVGPDPSIFVSVSARESFAALAISDAPVGVDIEFAGPPTEPLREVLHPVERVEMEKEWRSESRVTRFLETWIAKEAYLKALGTGLKRDPATVAIGFDRFGTFRVADDARPAFRAAGLWDAKIMGEKFVYCACVALDGRPVHGLPE